MLDTLLAYLPDWVQNLSTVILVVHGVLGFIAGYLTQQLSVTIYTVGIGFILSCIFVLPPWPFYRRNPLNWQPNSNKDNVDIDQPTKSSHTSGNKNTKKSR